MIQKNVYSCLPRFKVIEDEMIIGIITETNQFIGINPPEIDQYGDDLQILHESNYIVADTTSYTYPIVEMKRE